SIGRDEARRIIKESRVTRERASRASHATGASRRSGERGRVWGSPRGEAPRLKMRSFLVCIHDATPAYARETQVMICDLAPFVGRRLSFGLVPNWYGEWPLAAHPDYCRLVR